MDQDKMLRQKLINNLHSESHMPFEEAVVDFPEKFINAKAPNVDYTLWHLIEHIRITQWDILDFSKNPNYKEIEWPKDYWPAKNAKASKAKWNQSVTAVKNDLDAMIALVSDPQNDLYAKIPWGTGQTILREAIMVADHNAYHIGEFAILRQVLGAWPKKR